ncbi:Gp49 family protein [Acinetobacter radioresistens]|uniref:Gp49 family protein n=1 Tax=Acinetobacter radioresistens TaxID=40216 RepID=UPI0032135EC7
MSNSEQQIEQEIQEKGLNAPRLTPADIDAVIISEHYFIAGEAVGVYYSKDMPEAIKKAEALDTLTFCVLVLKNGFTITGESACASPENFDPEIGRKMAYENARNKIWMLEGYLLKEKLYQDSIDKQF